MGLFKRRRGMVDVVDMAKRGIVKVPARKTSALKAGKDGFVELSSSSSQTQTTTADNLSSDSNSGGVLDFFGNSSSNSDSSSSSSFSTETDGYNKREVDAKIETLDNKVYKLEQRIELLERKVGVNQPMW